MIPNEKPVIPALRIPAVRIEDLADFALSDLTRPLPALSNATDLPRPSAQEIRTVLEAFAHFNPLDAFLHRQKSLALAAALAEAAASGVKVPPPKAVGAGGAHAASHTAKAHQPSQKWVSRRFA